ncbi:MAG: LuxR C-terminal-related transcriptional regulator [Anaerolineales bacterium]|jgi:ATP/maltotriose-dependent transcriptional regulator MalT
MVRLRAWKNIYGHISPVFNPETVAAELEMIVRDVSKLEIGQRLALSHKTIARHCERIMKKMNLHSRIELVKFANHTGQVQL